MKNWITFILLLLTASSSAIAHGKNVKTNACKRIVWDEYKVHTIDATFDHATHIILPNKLLTDPLVGNEDLWVVDGGDRHVFIKPSSESKIGSSTTLTAITTDGRSYDFIVKRHNHIGDTCIRIEGGKMIDQNQRLKLQNYASPTEVESEMWQKRYLSLKSSASNNMETAAQSEKEAVQNAIRKYRYHIYTRYSWDTGSGFIGKNLISDVYDDGRFTYFRLNNTNKGLLTVEARLNGQDEILQAKYDDIAKIYRVVGIYPKFILKYNKVKISVTRGNNASKGEF